MIIDITSKLFILLAAYTLLHGAVYIWYQARKQGQSATDDRAEDADAITTPRRRTSSRIHSSPSRHQTLLLAAMLLAALILGGLAALASAP